MLPYYQPGNAAAYAKRHLIPRGGDLYSLYSKVGDRNLSQIPVRAYNVLCLYVPGHPLEEI